MTAHDSIFATEKKCPQKDCLLFAVLELIMFMHFTLTNFVLTKGQYIRLNSSGAALGMLLGAYIYKDNSQIQGSILNFVVALPLMYGVAKIGCAFADVAKGFRITDLCVSIPTRGIYFRFKS